MCVVGPTISTPPQNQEVLVGTVASFICTAVSDPLPTIHWSKDSVIVADDDRFQVSENGSVLTISQTTPNDAGSYTCTAQNTVVDLEKSIVLTVESSAMLAVVGKPIYDETYFIATVFTSYFVVCCTVPAQANAFVSVVNVVKGDTAVLQCYATGIPSPEFVWYKEDGQVVHDGDDFALFNGSLTIRASTVGDGGDYVCVATNKGGSSNATITLDVHC